MKHTIIILLLVAMVSGSCNKYLDTKRDAAQTIPTTLTDLQAMLDETATMNRKESGLDGAAADDYFLPATVFTSRSENAKKIYLWQSPVYNYSEADYDDIYSPVFIANLVLERHAPIEKVTYNSLVWNNVRGSALFFRSYYFIRLAWTYAKAYDAATAKTDLGIALRVTANFNDPSVRASVEETYQRILTDLKEAATLLPDLPQQVTRPSKAAAYGALARTYLSMRMYDSAYKYADLCLKIKPDLMNYNDFTMTTALPFQMYNKETIFFAINAVSAPISFGLMAPNMGVVDTLLYRSYVTDDLRRTGFFRSITGGMGFKGMYSGNNNQPFTGIATDEVYLMRAECLARAGNATAAMSDLNAVLIKRWKTNFFTPFTATDADNALSIILTERRKQLLYRDLRWMDVKRLNKGGANITLKRIVNAQTYTLPPNDNRYALPLPNDIINISGMPQNPS